MFFVLRCAFWLTLVAVALPWVATNKGAERVASRTRQPVHIAAVPAPPVAAPQPATSPGCSGEMETCIESAAKPDLIALALQDQPLGRQPIRKDRKVAMAVLARPVGSTDAKVDPIARELQRIARGD